MPNGQVVISGQQIATPEGGVDYIGPITLPCSTIRQSTVVSVGSSVVTVPVPPGSVGVLVLPAVTPGGTGTTYISGSATDTGIIVSGPCVISTTNSNLYLRNPSGTMTWTLRFF